MHQTLVRKKSDVATCPSSCCTLISSEDLSLLVAFLLITFSWLFRGPLLSRKTAFGPFLWLFRVGQYLRVLALEQSSDNLSPKSITAAPAPRVLGHRWCTRIEGRSDQQTHLLTGADYYRYLAIPRLLSRGPAAMFFFPRGLQRLKKIKSFFRATNLRLDVSSEIDYHPGRNHYKTIP